MTNALYKPRLRAFKPKSRAGRPRGLSDKSQAQVDRILRYYAENPWAPLRHVCEITGTNYSNAREWIKRKHLVVPDKKKLPPRPKGAPVIDTDALAAANRELQRNALDKARGSLTPLGSSGALPQPPEALDLQGMDSQPAPKVTDLRDAIKRRIGRSLGDPQAVQQYSAALKNLAAVRETEAGEEITRVPEGRVYTPAKDMGPDDE